MAQKHCGYSESWSAKSTLAALSLFYCRVSHQFSKHCLAPHCPLKRPDARSHQTPEQTQWTNNGRSRVLAQASCVEPQLTHAQTHLWRTHAHAHSRGLRGKKKKKSWRNKSRGGQAPIQALRGLGWTHTYTRCTQHNSGAHILKAETRDAGRGLPQPRDRIK